MSVLLMLCPAMAAAAAEEGPAVFDAGRLSAAAPEGGNPGASGKENFSGRVLPKKPLADFLLSAANQSLFTQTVQESFS